MIQFCAVKCKERSDEGNIMEKIYLTLIEILWQKKKKFYFSVDMILGAVAGPLHLQREQARNKVTVGMVTADI